MTLPSHSIEAEQAVLGSLLIDAEAWNRVAGRVTSADFFEPRHGLVFEAIAGLAHVRRGIDTVTVSEALPQEELKSIGGLPFLVELARNTPTGANAAHYADTVRDRAALRRLRTLGAQLVRGIDEQNTRDPRELATAVQERLLSLTATFQAVPGLQSASELTSAFVNDLSSLAEGRQGMSIGLADFDHLTGGLEPGNLVVIAGRPGMGKTALLGSIALTLARSTTVAVFSAEMPARQLMRRSIANLAGLSQSRLKDAETLTDADWAQVAAAASSLADTRLFIDEKAQPTLAHVRSECASLKARHGLGLVLVDYLQLLSGRGRNRYEELRDIAYGLKALAKDLSVPIIALAQLNREVEGRDEKRAGISDLRDSGAIEEAADVVGLLYREGYYDRDFGMPYVLECNLAKVRDGTPGQCLWHFAAERSAVYPLDSGAAMQYRRMLAEKSRRRTRGSDL